MILLVCGVVIGAFATICIVLIFDFVEQLSGNPACECAMCEKQDQRYKRYKRMDQQKRARQRRASRAIWKAGR